MADSNKYKYGGKGAKIQWNNEGFGAILQSPELQKVCLSAAKNIAAAAGDGFEANEWVSHKIGKVRYDRVAAIVSAATPKARRAEARNKVLQKAVAQCSIGTK